MPRGNKYHCDYLANVDVVKKPQSFKDVVSQPISSFDIESLVERGASGRNNNIGNVYVFPSSPRRCSI